MDYYNQLDSLSCDHTLLNYLTYRDIFTVYCCSLSLSKRYDKYYVSAKKWHILVYNNITNAIHNFDPQYNQLQVYRIRIEYNYIHIDVQGSQSKYCSFVKCMHDTNHIIAQF